MPRGGCRGPGPGVVAVAFAAASAPAGLPRRGRYQPGHGGHGRLPAGGQGDGEVHRGRNTYPFAAFSHASRSLELRPYTSSPPTHANGTPAAATPSTSRAQRGFGGERHVVRDAGTLPPLRSAPGLRQVEAEIEQGVRAGGDVGQEHDGLAVLHLPGDPGMLPGDPHRLRALFQFRGLIQHHDRLRITQVREDEPLQRGQRRLPVPGMLGQQRLHPPRRGMPGLLRQLPARLAVTAFGQQRADVRERRQTRSGLREHWREQASQLTVKFPQPGAIFYDGPGGPADLDSSQSMIMRWPSRISTRRRTHQDHPVPRSQIRTVVPACGTGASPGAISGPLSSPPLQRNTQAITYRHTKVDTTQRMSNT